MERRTQRRRVADTFTAVTVRIPASSYVRAKEQADAQGRTVASIVSDLVRHVIAPDSLPPGWTPFATEETGDAVTLALPNITRVAYLSPEDAAYAHENWHLGNKHVMRNERQADGSYRKVCLEQVITSCHDTQFANGNPLDCRRSNLLVYHEGDAPCHNETTATPSGLSTPSAGGDAW